jgi:hypothetical protein
MTQIGWRSFLLAALAAALPLVSSCATGDEPTALQLSGAIPDLAEMPCPTAKLINRSDLAAQFYEAMADACAVIQSAEFRDRVVAAHFARKCPRLFTKRRLMEGTQVYRALTAGLPADFEVTLRKVGSRRVGAETIAYDRAMSIEPDKFTNWTAGDRRDRALTVNTLVHEMTHLVRESDTTVWPLFQDEGGFTPWCDADRLVSYALGEIAQEVWENQHPAD